MAAPRQFLAIYECEECGEEMELVNCYFEYVPIFCEDCGEKTRFYAQMLEHRSWEWDRHED